MAAMTLQATNIKVSLGNTLILNDISLTISDGEMVAIVGPNGSGKSTLLRTLSGILKPSTGSVHIDSIPLQRISKRKLASLQGFLSQAAEIPQLTTVEEHVGLGRHPYRKLFSSSTIEDTQAINSAIDICQIDHLRSRRLSELSGGERQRVRLATLIAQNPKSLLLDEPLTGLDIEHQLTILELLKELNSDRKHTIVCVLHDLDLALRYFERIVVLKDGQISDDNTPEAAFCPKMFDTVFNVDGRIGKELSGMPVVVCRNPQCIDSCIDSAEVTVTTHGRQVPSPITSRKVYADDKHMPIS